MKDVIYQNDLGMPYGCLFMSASVLGGLGNNNCILLAKNWAKNKGYLRAEDTYVQTSSYSNCQINISINWNEISWWMGDCWMNKSLLCC